MTARVLLTYADLATLPDDGKLYELHEGELVVRGSPSPRHQRVVGNLYLLITAHVRRLGIGEVLLAPLDVILSDITVLQPDLIYLDIDRLRLVSDRGIEGPPTLAIEVLSPTTTAHDRGRKLQYYARYGVLHYWIVDAEARVIETHHLRGQSFEPGPRLEGTTEGRLPPFPDLALDPAAIWR
jgi:Uma2 family endonuclease